MDTTDRAILQQMISPRTHQYNPRVSYAEIARSTGIDEETVRSRVGRMSERGILQDWEVMVHPDLLDRELLRVELPDVEDADKEALLAQLSLLDGARVGFDHLQGGLAAAFFAPPGPPRERLLSLIGTLTDSRIRAWTFDLPPCDLDPTELDWRTIKALRETPRRPYHELAERIGVSSRTVRRRMDRLLDAKATLFTVDVDLTALSGVLSLEVRAFHSAQGDREAAVSALTSLEDRIFTGIGEEVSLVGLLRARVAEVVELNRELQEVEGIDEVLVDVLHRRILWDDWLDGAIEEQLAKAGGGV